MDWAILFLGLLVLMYGVSPVIVWLNVHQQAKATFEPYEAARYAGSESIRDTLQQWIAALAAEGFQVLADVFWDGPNKRVVLLRHPETGEEGVFLGAVPSGGTGEELAALTFAADFADRRELIVGNAELPSAFAPVPGKAKWAFPQVRDARRLLQVFRALEGRDYRGTTRKRPDLPALESISKSIVQELEEQLAAGYYKRDESTGDYRPTLKGAFLMSWKLQFPFGAIRKWLDRQRADAFLRESGLDAPTLPGVRS